MSILVRTHTNTHTHTHTHRLQNRAFHHHAPRDRPSREPLTLAICACLKDCLCVWIGYTEHTDRRLVCVCVHVYMCVQPPEVMASVKAYSPNAPAYLGGWKPYTTARCMLEQLSYKPIEKGKHTQHDMASKHTQHDSTDRMARNKTHVPWHEKFHKDDIFCNHAERVRNGRTPGHVCVCVRVCVTVHTIKCPTLLVVATSDAVTPMPLVHEARSRIGDR